MAGEPMRTPPGVSADTSPTTAQVEAERQAAGASSQALRRAQLPAGRLAAGHLHNPLLISSRTPIL